MIRSLLFSLATFLTACSVQPLRNRHLLVWIDVSRSFDAKPCIDATIVPAVRELRAGDRITVALINDATYGTRPLASMTLGVAQPGIDALITLLRLAPTASIDAR